MATEVDYRLPQAPTVDAGRASFLLGTDQHIGEARGSPETRVGITPEQLGELGRWLAGCGVTLRAWVVAGAGRSAGFPDDDYEGAGATIVEEAELPKLDAAPDVVHALKEPSEYEATIPGPYLRIGALHSGDFDRNPGLSRLLGSEAFCAIFDGSCVGGVSYRTRGGFPIPIRSQMSVFAGEIAAEKVLERLRETGAGGCVIVGGGAVGQAAARILLDDGADVATRITMIERSSARCDELRERWRGRPVELVAAAAVTDELIEGASGLILAAFQPGRRAPELVDVGQLARMATGGAVVDVAVDEGGSIAGPKQAMAEAITALGRNLRYVADRQLPRARPHEASIVHGRTILPYLGTLLHVAARHGSAAAAAAAIAAVDVTQPPADDYHGLISDLKNGLAFAGPRPVIIHPDAVKKKDVVRAYLDQQGIAYRMA